MTSAAGVALRIGKNVGLRLRRPRIDVALEALGLRPRRLAFVKYVHLARRMRREFRRHFVADRAACLIDRAIAVLGNARCGQGPRKRTEHEHREKRGSPAQAFSGSNMRTHDIFADRNIDRIHFNGARSITLSESVSVCILPYKPPTHLSRFVRTGVQ